MRAASGSRLRCLARAPQLASPIRRFSTEVKVKPTLKRNLLGLSYPELEAVFVDELKQPAYRANQIFHSIYKRGEFNIDNFTLLSKDLRAALKERFVINVPSTNKLEKSSDSTHKWLVGLCKGQEVESVFIPSENPAEDPAADVSRGALCVSSQVGCSLSCSFCHTGTMDKRNLRNLTADEIVGQLVLAKRDLGDFDSLAGPRPDGQRVINNIVFMGMGEPLLNYRQVKKALEIITHGSGLAFSKRRVTVSTSGVVPGIDKLGQEMPVSLAISLHAVNDALRDVLVPINKQFPIKMLLEACRRYPGVKPSRRVTFEYVMLKGVNDSIAEARELARMLHGIPSLVNLIPWNKWEGSQYESSSNNTVHKFAQELAKFGEAEGWVKSSIRWPRGRDISAACGQLAIKNLPKDKPQQAQATAAVA